MCILPDRCQGGTSYREGEVELMVHRRLLTDDGFGLDETLNEEELGSGLIVRGRHRLLLGNHKRDVDELTFSERMSHAAYRWQMEPWQFLAAGDKVNRRKWQSLRNKRFSALRIHGLPRHVRVLTLEPWKASSVLLRLENTLEKSDRATQRLDLPEELPLPSHVTVELKKVFQHLHIKSVRETTLGANQWLEEARQMDWSTRYVYTGGDDGLLPEDIDYVEEDKLKHKDSEPYPEEDADYIVRRNERRQPIKQRKRTVRYEDRRKRSINISENFVDNIFHTDAFGSEDFNSNKTTEAREHIKQSSNESKNAIFEVTRFTTVVPKLRFLSSKPREYFSDFRVSQSLEEEESSRTSSMQKNGRKKRPAGRFDVNTEEDDGVTASIYDMYYKRKTVAKPLKKALIRNFAEVTDPPRKQGKTSSKEVKVENKKAEVKKKKKKEKLTDPLEFRPRTARVYESGEEKEIAAEDEDEDLELARIRARRSAERRKGSKRRKRAAEARVDAPAPGAEPEPEYIVTLRPTQIRTFVVRFDNSRQNYVL